MISRQGSRRTTGATIIAATGAVMAVGAAPALASGGTGAGILTTASLNSSHMVWMMTATVLVLFLTVPGLALFYGGMVRSRNVLSVQVQCMMTAALASLIWLTLTYSLAFDASGGGVLIGGFARAFLAGVDANTLRGSVPETVFFMFQTTLAILAPALIVGAYVERVRLSSILLFITLWLILVHAPICYWVLGGGWLAGAGLMDSAGGLVIHATAGISALVVAHVIGVRKGFPDKLSPPHNPVIAITGACMIWVGWLALNAGGALISGGSPGMAMLVTHIAAASAMLAWMASDWFRFGRATVLGGIAGLVAGLAAITPASGFVGPLGAVTIGVAAGTICCSAVSFVRFVVRIDDALNVFTTHWLGCITGVLLVSIFASERLGGVGLPANMSIGDQFGIQVLGALSVTAFAGIVTYVIASLIHHFIGLRVTEEEEYVGLDISTHGERSYDWE